MDQKPNSGALFKNGRKLSDNHPDYQGVCVVDGKKKHISAWLKRSKNGVAYMSLAFSEPFSEPKER
jgi:uncharacterized protein (DUF736 family)